MVLVPLVVAVWVRAVLAVLFALETHRLRGIDGLVSPRNNIWRNRFVFDCQALSVNYFLL